MQGGQRDVDTECACVRVCAGWVSLCRPEASQCLLCRPCWGRSVESRTWFSNMTDTGVRVQVRYPFIPPEKLMSTVSKDKDFQKAAVLDDTTGMPLVLRAVFHQNGQRMQLNPSLRWVPRAGSLMYNGEWEWMYGPAALTDDKWPVDKKYAEIDFCWATDEEITNLGLFKAEIENLDKDGDGEPTVQEILATFMYYDAHNKAQRDSRAEHLKGPADDALRARKVGKRCVFSHCSCHLLPR